MQKKLCCPCKVVFLLIREKKSVLHVQSCFFANQIFVVVFYRSGCFQLVFSVGACLHGGGGPQVSEITRGGSPRLTCKRDHIKLRDYMDRRVTSPKRFTSPTWAPQTPYKQALTRFYIFFQESINIKKSFQSWLNLYIIKVRANTEISRCGKLASYKRLKTNGKQYKSGHVHMRGGLLRNKVLNGKTWVFWIDGRVWEMVAYKRLSHIKFRLYIYTKLI